MKYGDLPTKLKTIEAKYKEMLFYQYLPIKMIGEVRPTVEPRLSCFDEIIGNILCDFIGVFGIDKYVDSYVYLTAKYRYQMSGCSFNRNGYHSDGFMTDDINYIWYDKSPTIFNSSDFKITLDDKISMKEMEDQALSENEFM